MFPTVPTHGGSGMPALEKSTGPLSLCTQVGPLAGVINESGTRFGALRKEEEMPDHERLNRRRAEEAVTAAWDEFMAESDRVAQADPSRSGVGQLAHYQSVHPLWTPTMAACVPSVDEVGKVADPGELTAWYRFISPYGREGQWFVLGAQPNGSDVLFLAWACPAGDVDMAEVGYVGLSELRSIRGPFLLNIETDRNFKPDILSAVVPGGRV